MFIDVDMKMVNSHLVLDKDVEMHKLVSTKVRDNADDIEAESLDFDSHEDAVSMFKIKVQDVMDKILENEFLDSKISIHKNKAAIKIEGTRYCIAVVEES